MTLAGTPIAADTASLLCRRRASRSVLDSGARGGGASCCFSGMVKSLGGTSGGACMGIPVRAALSSPRVWRRLMVAHILETRLNATACSSAWSAWSAWWIARDSESKKREAASRADGPPAGLGTDWVINCVLDRTTSACRASSSRAATKDACSKQQATGENRLPLLSGCDRKKTPTSWSMPYLRGREWSRNSRVRGWNWRDPLVAGSERCHLILSPVPDSPAQYKGQLVRPRLAHLGDQIGFLFIRVVPLLGGVGSLPLPRRTTEPRERLGLLLFNRNRDESLDHEIIKTLPDERHPVTFQVLGEALCENNVLPLPSHDDAGRQQLPQEDRACRLHGRTCLVEGSTCCDLVAWNLYFPQSGGGDGR